MLKSRETAHTEQTQNSRLGIEILQIPRSDVTLAALDILLENTLRQMNGMQLKSMVEERLERRVNYSGVLKQVRSYADKPYWNQVLVCQRKSFLCFYARESPLTHKLHQEIHALYGLSNTLNEAVQLRRELDALRSQLQADPLCDMKKIKKRTRQIDTKLKTLLG